MADLIPPHTFVADPSFYGMCLLCRQHRGHIVHRAPSPILAGRP